MSRESAALALEQACAGLGIELTRVADVGSGEIELEWEGRRIRLDIKTSSQLTGARARELSATPLRQSSPRPMLVADRITAEGRAVLAEAGWSWLDRRGHLHLRGPGMLVDRPVPALTAPRTVPASPIRGKGGLTVAYWLCSHPHTALSPTKSGLTLAPSTVSTAVTELKKAGLVDAQGQGIFPELFWELASVWRPSWAWLATAPTPDDAPDVEKGTSWSRVDDHAALSLGAPLMMTHGGPLELFVGGPVEVTIAQRRFGVAREGLGAAAVAVAPVGAAVSVDEGRRDEGWRVAPRLAVALQLATTGARGREVLAAWEADDGVWA